MSADGIDERRGPRLTQGQANTAKVALIFASGIAINKVSEYVDLSLPIIIVGALVILVAMLFIESLGAQGGEDSAVARNLDLLKFCLASVILGGLIGGLWIIPLFSYRTWKVAWPWAVSIFDTYELGAALCIAILAALAAHRHKSVLHVAAFLVSSITGMTMVVSLKAPDRHIFVDTFIGWSALGAAMVTLAYIWPDVFRMFRQFWGK
ncbi:hypothetical protein ACIQMJ_29290 [Actinosynnema sp. NPDC091369]